jgi:hypothetical protein
MNTHISYLHIGASLEANKELLCDLAGQAFDSWFERMPEEAIHKAFFTIEDQHIDENFNDEALKAAA